MAAKREQQHHNRPPSDLQTQEVVPGRTSTTAFLFHRISTFLLFGGWTGQDMDNRSREIASQINYNPSVLMANNNDKTTIRSLIINAADYNSADCRPATPRLTTTTDCQGGGRWGGSKTSHNYVVWSVYVVCTGHDNPLSSTPLVPFQGPSYVGLISFWSYGWRNRSMSIIRFPNENSPWTLETNWQARGLGCSCQSSRCHMHVEIKLQV